MKLSVLPWKQQGYSSCDQRYIVNEITQKHKRIRWPYIHPDDDGYASIREDTGMNWEAVGTCRNSCKEMVEGDGRYRCRASGAPPGWAEADVWVAGTSQ